VTLVMTLVVRDEQDIVDAQIAFHLNAGVDFVLAVDHQSSDGTAEILRRYEREGHLRLFRRSGEYLESAWRTELAALAATEHGAEWVFSSDADEFWWPRGESLVEVLRALPKRYGIVRALWRQFVPRPDDGAFFAERMTVRIAAPAPINDPLSQWRPNTKVVHRARPDVTVSRGGHDVVGPDLVPLRGWYPIEVLHFPVRSRAQLERKAGRYEPSHGVRFHEPHRLLHEALRRDGVGEAYDALVVDDSNLAHGLEERTLVLDERLRDVLRELAGRSPIPPDAASFALPGDRERTLRFPTPTVVDDAAFAAEVAALEEANAIRALRQLDALEQRVARLERRPVTRAIGLARRLFRQNRGGGD
jgi:hypothetical protein